MAVLVLEDRENIELGEPIKIGSEAVVYRVNGDIWKVLAGIKGQLLVSSYDRLLLPSVEVFLQCVIDAFSEVGYTVPPFQSVGGGIGEYEGERRMYYTQPEYVIIDENPIYGPHPFFGNQNPFLGVDINGAEKRMLLDWDIIIFECLKFLMKRGNTFNDLLTAIREKRVV